ncbi:MAG: lactate permease [Actinomycetota bacterium]|jgi:lactate permease|nr:lactate permease [Actinomycetota bacterium]
MYRQQLDPVGDSLAASAAFAVLPLLTLFVLLGVLKLKAWIAAVASLAVAIVVAIAVYSMPVGQTLLSATEGAAFGFFPILWIVINAIWVYNLTVATGHFDVLRRSFSRVSPDQRVQAIIIAFCFGALLEALAGFGTPVAITVVMLMALGFRPIKAASVALIANTAPVAFGALATPIVTLATVTSGVSNDPRLNTDTLGAMVGRQTPILAIVVPLILVLVVDGRRGLRQTWLPALAAGVSFGIAQFVASNYISVQLTDIVAALVSAAAVVGLLRVWKPAESPIPGDDDEAVGMRTESPAAAGHSGSAVGGSTAAGGTTSAAARTVGGGGTGAPVLDDSVHDRPAEVARAYAPYLIIIVIFAIVNIGPIKSALGEKPWTYKFNWPGLDVQTTAGEPQASMTYTLNWLPAAGTLMILAGLITMAVLKVSPSRALQAYKQTYVELRWAILTVMAVLALAYVMNQSGQTGTLGALLAETGGTFVVLSSILGWLGVAVTGSDTSANALFGALQVQTAKDAGLDPVLLAAANSSGGVLGKMISPQNLAIAAAAVGMAGQEGVIFRKVVGWSLLLLVLMCLIVGLQGTPVLDWMIPTKP